MDEARSAREDRDRRLEWFRRAHFGAYLWWGLHSQLGRGEWVMNRERIPIDEYERLTETAALRPDVARHWVSAVKSAGMRYMVMTAKHHDGYCLFDSKASDYNSVANGPGRDVIAEYVDAARSQGIGVGIYYSQMDWHHPDGVRCKKHDDARKRFVEYTHALVRELCTNYGKIDIWWWDVSWPLDFPILSTSWSVKLSRQRIRNELTYDAKLCSCSSTQGGRSAGGDRHFEPIRFECHHRTVRTTPCCAGRLWVTPSQTKGGSDNRLPGPFE